VSVLLLSRLRVSGPDCALRCCAALHLCIVVRLPKEPYDARRVRITARFWIGLFVTRLEI
jgi:hypothetical protein